MKKYILIVFGILLIGLIVYSFSDRHVNRNSNNRLPVGSLVQIDKLTYQDQVGLIWEIQTHSQNVFHQPEELPKKLTSKKYDILENSPFIDPKHPNIKLLCFLPSGASYEAILQPNGTYLNRSGKQGTYNYSSPKGFWGTIKHGIIDVLPHFINSNYYPTEMSKKS